MEKYVKKYHLKDPQQYEDEREYWRSKTPEERLMALEAIRREYMNMKGMDPDQPIQKIVKIINRSES